MRPWSMRLVGIVRIDPNLPSDLRYATNRDSNEENLVYISTLFNIIRFVFRQTQNSAKMSSIGLSA